MRKCGLLISEKSQRSGLIAFYIFLLFRKIWPKKMAFNRINLSEAVRFRKSYRSAHKKKKWKGGKQGKRR